MVDIITNEAELVGIPRQTTMPCHQYMADRMAATIRALWAERDARTAAQAEFRCWIFECEFPFHHDIRNVVSKSGMVVAVAEAPYIARSIVHALNATAGVKGE